MKYYHLTKKENIESILKNGILPKCGENTSLVESDIGNYIFFTNKKNLQIWSLFLNRHYVVEIELNNRLKRRDYNAYSEYYTNKEISPQYIVNHYEFNPSRVSKHTKELLFSYLEYMSFVCDDYLDYDTTLKDARSIAMRKDTANTLYVFAINPIYFDKYIDNYEALCKQYFSLETISLLKYSTEKEVNKNIKRKVKFFINYLEKCIPK